MNPLRKLMLLLFLALPDLSREDHLQNEVKKKLLKTIKNKDNLLSTNNPK